MTLSYDNQWQSHPRLAIDAETLIQRWQNLQGTPVPEKILATLKRQLPPAQILWITLKQQPAFALTIYQFPDFWLMQNWQQQWLAVSVNSEYLFPPRQVSRE